jgi:hypothetical protein
LPPVPPDVVAATQDQGGKMILPSIDPLIAGASF